MKTFHELFVSAYEQFSSKDFAAAIILCNQAESVYEPSLSKQGVNLEDLYILKGSCYYSVSDFEQAKGAFEKALRISPNSSLACQGLGKVLFIEGNLEGSKVMLEYAVQYDPTNETAQQYLDEVIKVIEEESEGERESEISQKLSTERSGDPGYDSLGDAYKLFSQKKYDEALQLLGTLQTEYEIRLASVQNFTGFNYLALQQFTEAKRFFELALTTNPKSSQANAGLGEYYYLNNDDSKASEYFFTALKLNPMNEFAKAGLKKLGKEVPVTSGTKNRELNDIVTAAYDKFSQKDFAAALMLLNSAEHLVNALQSAENETKSSYYNFKGFINLSLQRTEDAKEMFETALKIDSKSSQACAGLGEVLYIGGEDEKAKVMFEHAVNNNPENSYAKSSLAKINKSLGYPETHNSLFM